MKSVPSLPALSTCTDASILYLLLLWQHWPSHFISAYCLQVIKSCVRASTVYKSHAQWYIWGKIESLAVTRNPTQGPWLKLLVFWPMSYSHQRLQFTIYWLSPSSHTITPIDQKLDGSIDACRPRHTRALPGLFRIMRTHIMRTGHEDTWSPAYSVWVHRHMYSIQCSDKICFPQLCIKCDVAKSCPGTHTALQVPMVWPLGAKGHTMTGSVLPRHVMMSFDTTYVDTSPWCHATASLKVDFRKMEFHRHRNFPF